MTDPLLTVLAYSAGKQSTTLLWMVLDGALKVDLDKFIVLNADPGMENSLTYKHVERMKEEAWSRKRIEIITVPGPNLYEDMIGLKDTDKIRFDTPAFWTPPRKEGGREGRLKQGCTQIYKIAPMDRLVRKELEERYGIKRNNKRIGEEIVCKWIGFSFDEVVRVKPPKQKYVRFEYPLIDLGMTGEDCTKYLIENNHPVPPRSVCNACFANGLSTLGEMYRNRPADWQQAVDVDESARDWTQIGVEKPVFVSKTLIPLKEIPGKNLPGFEDDLENDYSCDSGYCFV